MVEICMSIAGKIAEYTVAPVLRQFGYLIYYKSNVEDLTQKVTSLTAKRDGVQIRRERANRNSEIILPEVDDWLDRVQQTLHEKEKCFEKGGVEKATTCCSSNRWCPNLKVRRSLSRKATKMAPKVDGLLTEGDFPTISCPAPAPTIEYPCIEDYYEDITEVPTKQPHEGSGASNPTNPPAPMDLSERLEYRLPYTKDLLKALQNDKTNMIGISGIIREIDTVTTKEFIKRMKHRNLFEEVVMAVVSQQDPDLKRIQGEIADMLHLKLEDGSSDERAERLRAAMSAMLNSKRLLLILADVRQVLDLETIGISSGDGNKTFKIILISQLPNVFGEMTTQTNFELLLQSPPLARPVEFESRISVIRDVMDALTDDESNPIVLCGMGGIGKTTLVKEIGAKADEVDLFDDVAFAEFTQEPDLVKIQGKIAKDLGLELSENDDRAAKLRERLSGGTKRVLVILDNVWTDNSSPDQLTLWEVGIPISRDPKSCKVLVSSREQDIFKKMKTKKNFPIAGLPQKDAWSLFKKVVGGSIENDLELRPIAEQVLKECDGLPVAITTVGRALQGKSIPEWRDALRQLKMACPEDVPGVIKHVYGKIEFSYECLPSEQAKSCFLLCCVFPESASFSVELLFRLGFGLGLFKGIDSIAAGRDRFKTLVETLKSRFLLLDSDKEDGEEMVKIHDVVRDVAVYIASEESTQKKNDELKKRIVLRQRVELNGWPTNEESTCTSLATLATSTGGLTELLLFIDGNELKLPTTIFNGMEDLRVLLIQYSILPSIPLLKNLQTLIIHECQLNLDAIGELHTLMILDLRGSDVEQLPDTFKNLSNLRMLDLTGCYKLKTIAAGVISSLSRLEELYMRDSFQDWVVEKLASAETTNWISQLEDQERSKEDVSLLEDEESSEEEEEDEVSSEEEEVVDIDMWKKFNKLAVEKLAPISQLGDGERSEPEQVDDLGELYREEVENSDRKDEFTRWANSMDWRVGILSELLSLSRLTTLQVVLPPVDILLRTSCKLFHELKRFQISIGWEDEDSEDDIEDYENYLRVADLDASSLAGTEITLLLKETNALELKLKNLTDPLNVLDTEYCCAKLEKLKLEDCDALEYLIDLTLMKHTPRSVFPVLDHLHIEGASRLKEIFHGDLPQGSLQKLKRLDLCNLPALTYVWKVESQSGCLGNLALVDTIDIQGCQSLEAMFGLVGSGHHEEEAAPEINFLSLTTLTLEHLPSFTRISNSKVYFPVLRHLNIQSLGNLKEIWNSQLSPNSFCELTNLEVKNCDKLLHLVPTYRQNRLQKLESIKVYSCSSLEEIFEVRRLTVNEGEEKEGESILPRLKRLDLWNLPALTYVWKVESQSECLGNLAHVETIHIKGCQSLEAMFGLVGSGHHQEEAPLEINFLSLTSLTLEDVPSFTWISNSNYKRMTLFVDPKVYFPVLTDLHINGLGNLKEIWNTQLSPNSFCELTYLAVKNCDKLLHLVPAQMQNRLQKLERIEVQDCSSLEEIFEVRRLTVNEGDASTISPSKKIPSSISQPDQGRQINNIMDFKQSRQGFQNLTSLQVTGCHSFRYLLSPSIARVLVRLERLYIRDCKKIEEIVAAAEGESILPRLKYLYLRNLPALTYAWKVESQSGCLGNLAHVETIDIQRCQSLEAMFGLVGSGHHEEEAALEINFLSLTSLTLQDIPSFTWISNSNFKRMTLFFDPKVYFPVLTDLHINGLGNLKEIWNTQLSPNSFCELTYLAVKNCDKLLHLVPAQMQNRLQKLERIEVQDCSSLEEIFEVRRLTVNEGDASTISPSKKIPSSISQPDQGRQINNIMDFKQSRQGFQNLTSLQVTGCHSFRYLLSPSIARVLVRLERLYIRDCKKIEEIVAAAEGESILPRLKYLYLRNLPALTYAWKVESQSGCLGNLAHVETIDIQRCQSLEAMFGLVGSGHHEEEAALEINFLSLTSLTLQDIPSFTWISNSNFKRMTLFFDPKVHFPVLKKLDIGGPGNLKEIWNSQHSPNSFCELTYLRVLNCDKLLHLVLNDIMDFKHSRQGFQNLTSLEVTGCHSVRYLLSPSVARGLVRLERLTIGYCQKIEEIVAAAEGEEKEDESILPRLKNLSLWYLPNLGSFSQGKYTFDWPLVDNIDILQCNKMNNFCSGSLSIPREVDITVHDSGENLEQELKNCRKKI